MGPLFIPEPWRAPTLAFKPRPLLSGTLLVSRFSSSQQLPKSFSFLPLLASSHVITYSKHACPPLQPSSSCGSFCKSILDSRCDMAGSLEFSVGITVKPAPQRRPNRVTRVSSQFLAYNRCSINVNCCSHALFPNLSRIVMKGFRDSPVCHPISQKRIREVWLHRRT